MHDQAQGLQSGRVGRTHRQDSRCVLQPPTSESLFEEMYPSGSTYWSLLDLCADFAREISNTLSVVRGLFSGGCTFRRKQDVDRAERK